MNSEKQSTNLQMILREVNRVGEGQKNVPKLRFKGYEDAWEQRKLGSAINVRNGKDYKHLDEGDVPVYGTGGYMLSVSEALENTQDAIGIGRKGTIDKPFVLKAPFWTVDTLFYCIPKGNNYLGFLYPLFQSINWKLYDESTGVPSLSKTAIEGVTINLTGKDEQYSIGEYFEIVDTLITLHQRKYDALKTMKKTLLSKMFPKDGEDVPEIRFKGFTDAWEQRKVSEITKFHKQGYYTTEEYNDNKKYYLLRGTDLTGNKLVLKDTPKINASEKDYDAFKTEIGDFLIVRSGNVGTYGIVDIDIPAIFGSYLIDFRFDTEKVTNEFFGYFYQSERFQSQLNKITQSSANININAENIKSTYISLPVLTEQKKISNIMSTLDNCITLHQRKLDELKNMKKTLLQQMFV